MKEITEEMVVHLNEELRKMGSGIRMIYNFNSYGSTIHISILDPCNFVDSSIINPTDDFYLWLDNWFKNYDITLSYNNTGNIMWAKGE